MVGFSDRLAYFGVRRIHRASVRLVPIRVATASVYHSDMPRPDRPHRWRYRDELPGKVMVPRYLATEADACER